MLLLTLFKGKKDGTEQEKKEKKEKGEKKDDPEKKEKKDKGEKKGMILIATVSSH